MQWHVTLQWCQHVTAWYYLLAHLGGGLDTSGWQFKFILDAYLKERTSLGFNDFCLVFLFTFEKYPNYQNLPKFTNKIYVIFTDLGALQDTVESQPRGWFLFFWMRFTITSFLLNCHPVHKPVVKWYISKMALTTNIVLTLDRSVGRRTCILPNGLASVRLCWSVDQTRSMWRTWREMFCSKCDKLEPREGKIKQRAQRFNAITMCKHTETSEIQ